MKKITTLALLFTLTTFSFAGITPPIDSLLPPQTGQAGKYLSTDGSVASWQTTGGAGTVTSVGLSLPSIFAVTGSPVTASGTLTGTLNTQSANLVFAGPTSGGAAIPTFRSIVAADLPSLGGTYAHTNLDNVASIAIPNGSHILPANSGQVNIGDATHVYNNINTAAIVVDSIFGSGGGVATILPNTTILRTTGSVNMLNWGTSSAVQALKPIRFVSGVNYVEVAAPVLAGNVNFTFPTGNGTSGQMLTTDGSGNLSYVTPFSPSAVGTDLLPATDLTYSLGSNAKKWLTGVIATINTSSINAQGTGDISINTSGSGSNIIMNPNNAVDFSNKNIRNITQLGLFGNGRDVAIKPSATTSASYTITLPPAQGASGQVQRNDGSGIMSWAAPVLGAKERATLSGTNITNQYICMSHIALNGTVIFAVKAGGLQMETDDYTVSYTDGACSGNTKVTFVNDLATGGPSALIAGDIVTTQYLY